MSNDYYAACTKCVAQAVVTLKGNETLKDRHIHPDDEQKVAHSSFGGMSVGRGVTFYVSEHLLQPDGVLVDGYGDVWTVKELIDSRGVGTDES